MSFKAIGEALNTKITEAVGTRVKAVYNYDVIDEGILTPFVQIAPDNSRETILDTANNEVDIDYVISIVDDAEANNTNRTAMESNIRDLVDVISELIKDLTTITYDNGHARVVSYRYEWGYVQKPTVQRVAVIRVKFLAIEDK